MNSARMHIGVDVGKAWLDVCYPDGRKERIRNIKSCRTKLIAMAAKLDAIVSFEATGPYEEPLADECLAKGVRALRLDAWGARRFAESQGRIEKTDAIDCEMIRDYAASLKEAKLHFVKPRSEAQKRLRKAVSARRNYMKAKALVCNQLENNPDADMKNDIKKLVGKIDAQIAKLEAECDAAIESDPRMKDLSRRFQEVKGVGPCLTWAILAYCPDIGEFNEKSIAKMCGDAPIGHESCTIKNKARPKRGRFDLKKALYMAAVSGSRSNHILHGVYQRLTANGKPKKVALTAVARHIAILLNYIAKYPDFKPERDPRDVERENRPKRPRGRPRKTA